MTANNHGTSASNKEMVSKRISRVKISSSNDKKALAKLLKKVTIAELCLQLILCISKDADHILA